MAPTPSRPGPRWSDRLTSTMLRWSTLIALAVGAFTLFFGLGKNGLWEPWEMDRADLARTLSHPSESIVALGGASSEAEVLAIHQTGEAAGVAIKRPDLAPSSALRSALDLARTRVVSSIVIDSDLLLPDAARDDLWRQAGKLLAEAARHAAGGKVLILRRADAPAAAELSQRLALERARDQWNTAAGEYGLDKVWQLDQLEVALASAVQTDDFAIVETVAELAAPLAEAASATSMRVAFKDKGQLKVVAPLESWLRATAYGVLGATEFATRLPGVLLCFLALWALVTTARTVWGPRVALVSGLVLATMPLFFGQARVISGEPSLILAVTLVACGFLLAQHDNASRRLSWTYWAVALLIGALGGGAFALALLALIALAVPLTMGTRSLSGWAPAALFVAATALVQLVATSAGPASFLAGLDYKADLFSETYTLYHKTFDIVVRDLGFGMAPWSPVVVVAAGLLLFSSLAQRDPRGLVVSAWFFLPVVAAMLGIKTGDRFLFAGVGGAALAVGIFVDRLLTPTHELRPGTPATPPKYFIAFALLAMFYILRRELKPSPEPLVGFLAFDPPFAREGSLRFPETVTFDGLYKTLFILVALAVFSHFSRFGSFALAALRWLRRPRPFLIMTGVALLLTTLVAIIVVGRLHALGMGSAYADSIQTAQRTLPGRLAGPSDPMMLLAATVGALALLIVVLRSVFPGVGAAIGVHTDALRAASRWLLPSAVGAWALALILVASDVALPSGYLGEVLLATTGALALAAALLSGLAARALGSWLEAAQVAAGVVMVVVLTQLARDASLAKADTALYPIALALLVVGLILLTLAYLPRLLADISRLVFAACAVLALIGLHYLVVLIDRGVDIAPVIYSTEIARGTMSAFGAAFPPLAVLIPLSVIVLTLNRYAPAIVARFAGPDRADATNAKVARWGERAAELVQHRYVAVGALGLVAAVATLSFLFRLEPVIAVNVSQKHFIDTWFGKAANDPGSMYKHGAFGSGQGRKDTNFYTNGVPEVRDRQAALRVLLGREDQILELETPNGSETRYIPGFSPLNDKDGDGKRDTTALTGFATAFSDTTLTDASARWTPNALVGKQLGDATGRTWNIVANDETSVTVAATDRLTFAPFPRTRAFYVIDERGATLRATATEPVRRAFLLPAEQLSELNYAWRQLSGGSHLPVLDGSSYRVLLASSWLAEGERQQNRLALATYTDQTFAELKDPRLKRVWGTFDDTLQLVGYSTDKDVVSSGGRIRLTLYMKTLKPVKKSLKFFVHCARVAGGGHFQGDHWPLNPTRHSEDNKNCNGCYRTDHWLVGDIVADTYEIEVPEGNTGEHMIWMGLYTPGGADTRAVLRDWDKKNARHDGSNRLGIGTFRVK